TVLLDGQAVRSCLLFAVQLDGAAVTTIEGLTPSDGLSRLQEAFRAKHGLQCGFCTPGMIVASQELLGANPAPSREEIREALAGNLCMCTGYVNVVRAVETLGQATDDGRRTTGRGSRTSSDRPEDIRAASDKSTPSVVGPWVGRGLVRKEDE